MVSIVASQQEGSWFDSQLGPFCVEVLCSPCVMHPTVQKMFCPSECGWLCVWFVSVWPCDGLATRPGSQWVDMENGWIVASLWASAVVQKAIQWNSQKVLGNHPHLQFNIVWMYLSPLCWLYFQVIIFVTYNLSGIPTKSLCQWISHELINLHIYIHLKFLESLHWWRF